MGSLRGKIEAEAALREQEKRDSMDEEKTRGSIYDPERGRSIPLAQWNRKQEKIRKRKDAAQLAEQMKRRALAEEARAVLLAAIQDNLSPEQIEALRQWDCDCDYGDCLLVSLGHE
jgi:hypothetical protein